MYQARSQLLESINSLAVLFAGLYAGGSLLISLVTHPARLAGIDGFALEHIRREHDYVDKVLPVFLLSASILSIANWYFSVSASVLGLFSGLILLSIVPYSIFLVGPVLLRLLDKKARYEEGELRCLLQRWGRLHWVRTMTGLVGFSALLFVSQ